MNVPSASDTRTLRPRVSVRAAAVWVVTRSIGVCLLAGQLPYSPGFARVNGDVHLYASWSRALLHGAVPYHDFGLMYPPGVIPFLAFPHGSTNTYVAEFTALALVADLICLLLLARRGDRGVWLWIVAVPLLGPVSWGRLDIFVALALIAAISAIEEGHQARAGASIAFAALIKLWPLLLLAILLPPMRSRERFRFLGSAAVLAGVFLIPLLALGAMQGLRSSVMFEAHRGVELESLPALPLHLAQVLGSSWHTDVSFGSWDVVTAQTGLVRTVSEVVLLSGWLFLAVWAIRTRRHPLSPASWLLILVSLTLVTNRVLSPQYMLWLAAATALCIDSTPDPRRLGIWTCLAMASTQAMFPFLFAALAAGTVPGFLVAALHAVLVVAVAFVALAETRRQRCGVWLVATPATRGRTAPELATAGDHALGPWQEALRKLALGGR